MKVKMLRTAAGPAWTYGAGQVVDLADDLGAAFVACGAAVPVGDPPPDPAPVVEEAVVEPDESRPAVMRKGRGGRR